MTTIRVVGQFDAKSHPGVICKMITSSTSPVGNPFVVGLDGDRKLSVKASSIWSGATGRLTARLPRRFGIGLRREYRNTHKAKILNCVVVAGPRHIQIFLAMAKH